MNRSLRYLSATALLFPVWLPSAAQEGGAVPLDLLADQDAWRGDEAFFRFEDGILVGESTVERPCERTTYLVREDLQVADFELSVRYRLRGGNSGVQFRSRVLEGADGHLGVAGYQADLEDGPNWTGCLYEQEGRGVMARRGERVSYGTDGLRLAETVADGGALLEALRAGADGDGWSSYRITAAGPALRLEVNGVVTTEVFDLDAERARDAGVLAIQLHQGPPMRIEVAEMRLRPLAPEEVADLVSEVEEEAPATPRGNGRPHWIWGPDEPGEHEVVWFHRDLSVDFPVVGGTLRAAADNLLEVQLDGQVVAVATDWAQPVRRALDAEDPLIRLLRPGEHSLRVRAENEGGPAGMWLDLELHGGNGERLHVRSGAGWSAGGDRWDGAVTAARDLGPLGIQPWGEPSRWSDGRPPEVLDPAAIEVAPGFRVEHVYTVPRHRQGSWISLAFDPRGRLYASDQYGDLWRLTPGPAGAAPVVEAVALPLGEAHGLAFVGEDLYAIVGGAGTYESGLHRARDTDGDGELDAVEALRLFSGSGEHGPHAVVPTRDGTGLWVIAGNHTPVPEFVEPGRVPSHWGEDQLLPTIEDPNGHANGKRAPAGWLARCDLEGDAWELWSIGMRNAYDVAETDGGELFTFDSDMEWDVGLPWYRPTRILHLVPGADFGWRTGSGKFPAWVPDSLPAVVDLGKSSPTGVLLGAGSTYPGRWQEALFAADWAYGTIFAVHLTPRGASFGGTADVFVRGAPLPVTDLALGPDGALWFAVGGRRAQSGVYRVVLDDADAALAALPDPMPAGDARARALRHRIEAEEGGASAGERLEALVSDDPFLRHAARTAEDSGRAGWDDAPSADGATGGATDEAHMRAWLARATAGAGVSLDPWLSLERLLSIVRTGPAGLAPEVHATLDRLESVQLDREQTLALLRVRELALVRLGLEPTGELAPLLTRHQARLAAAFPAEDADLDRQRGRLLAFFASAPARPLGLPEVGAAALLTGALERARSQEDAIEWLYLLRNVVVGWTPELRTRAWAAFEARQADWKGGHSARKYVDRIVEDLEAVAPRPGGPWAEREAGAGTGVEAAAGVDASPFVRAWTLDELAPRLTALDDAAWGTRDLERGAAAYRKASCHTCHRFGEVDMATGGGGVGPDLTGVARRFGTRDLLRTMVEPSEAIADQYQDVEVWTVDDELFVGRIAERTDARVVVALAAPEEGEVEIPLGEVDEIRPHPLSRMPAGLLDVLTADEVIDLVAYLRSGLGLLDEEETDAAAAGELGRGRERRVTPDEAGEGSGPAAPTAPARVPAGRPVGAAAARVVLGVVLGLQAALALLAQAGRVLLDDEVGTWRAASGGFGTVVTSFDEWQTQPGYFLAAKLSALVLGPTELALRLPALAFALLLTGATYALVARLMDRVAGLLAAALVALHPFLLFYGQMARGYSMALALSVLSLLCVHRLARGDGGRWTGVTCVLARGLSAYAHLGACATFPGELLLAWAATRTRAPAERRRGLRRAAAWVVGGALLAAALYAPLLPGMLAFRERWTGAGSGGFGLGFVPLVARVYGGGDTFGAALLGLLSAAGFVVLVRRPATRASGLALAVAVAGVVAFYALLDTAHYPWAFARFLTPLLPLLLVFVAVGLRASMRRWGAVAAGLAAIAVVVVAYRDAARVAFGPRDLDWRVVLDGLAEEGPRTLVLAPVRFHAAEPYLARLEGSGVRVLRVEQLPEVLARGGLEPLAAAPLTVLQDVVPTAGLEPYFARTAHGATTRLDLLPPATRADRPADARTVWLLRALRALAAAEVAFLEPYEGRPIDGPWVFWRLHARHEHPFAATLSHGAAQALAGVTAGMLGDAAAAESALTRARALRANVPVPGAVLSSW